MRLSKQLYVTDLSNSWKGVYSPFGHHMAFLSKKTWENLKKRRYHLVNEAIIRYLVESNILVKEGFEEKWLHSKFREPKIGFNAMFLVITLQCNFACRYCVVLKNINDTLRFQDKMSPHIASLAVDFFERHLCRLQPHNARVTFYGGEPMLNQEAIFHVVPKIKAIRYPRQVSPVEIVMITNGYLYNPMITDLFRKYNVGVCVSIDGKEHHHDMARITKGEDGTFDRVIRNYRKYQTAGCTMGISCTLGHHNTFDLPEIAEFFAKDLKPQFVEFQIPYHVSGKGNPMWVSTTEITKQLMEAYEVLRSYDIVEGTTYRRLRDFVTGKIHYTDCGAPGSQLVVAPDGKIGPCHSLVGSRTYYAGNITDPDCDPVTLDNFQEWSRRFPLNMPICRNCPFITICGGGCPYNAYVSAGSIWAKDPQVCVYMKEMIEWILRYLWKKTGMADRHGTKHGRSGP